MINYSASPTFGKRRAVARFFAIVLLLFWGLAWKPNFSQGTAHDSKKPQSNGILEQQVTLILPNISVKNALHALSNRANLPIGLVGVGGENGAPKQIEVKAVKRPVQEILDGIVKSDDRYRWEIVNGVVNVSPVSAPDNISGLKIGFLQLTEIEVLNVGSAILDAPEIRRELEAMGKAKTDEFNYSGRPIKNARISAIFSNTTIKDGLNELLSTGRARFWTIERFGQKDEFIRIILFD